MFESHADCNWRFFVYLLADVPSSMLDAMAYRRLLPPLLRVMEVHGFCIFTTTWQRHGWRGESLCQIHLGLKLDRGSVFRTGYSVLTKWRLLCLLIVSHIWSCPCDCSLCDCRWTTFRCVTMKWRLFCLFC